MEVLSENLLSVLERRNYHGLSVSLMQTVLRQVVQALCLFRRAGVLHLDIKPENLVLVDLESPRVKVIDFGSSRLIGDPIGHFYVQSRWYRAPEVVLELAAGFEADMWSVGATAIELFLGTPLVPAGNEFQLIAAIVDRFGALPRSMIEASPRRVELFDREGRLKSVERMCREHRVECEPMEDYFTLETVRDSILSYTVGMGTTRAENVAEQTRRNLFADFVEAALKLDPAERITAGQARDHPFLRTEL
jgi:dual specificity protein kinase YAK1